MTELKLIFVLVKKWKEVDKVGEANEDALQAQVQDQAQNELELRLRYHQADASTSSQAFPTCFELN